MPYNPLKHPFGKPPQGRHRHSIRLRGYDYARPGAYYIKIVTHRRSCIFGEIIDGEIRLDDWGGVAETCWRAIPDHFPNVELDEFIIVPDHVHAIIAIMECGNGSVGAQQCCTPTKSPNPHVVPGSIGTNIRSYKSAVTTRINQFRAVPHNCGR